MLMRAVKELTFKAEELNMLMRAVKELTFKAVRS